jgi:predicted DNA-binding transcriptional regulator AlpA
MTNDDPLLETPEAAKYLGVSVPTLDRWRALQLGPDYCKMVGLVKYRRSGLDRYIASSTRVAKAKRNGASKLEAL